MALNANVTVTSTGWTQLTNANASAIRVQNLSAAAVSVVVKRLAPSRKAAAADLASS